MNKSDGEIWKTYPEFDFIQGSNLGEVRTVNRYVKRGNGKLFVKGRILKQQLNRGGYLYVNFGDNGKFITRYVHRIIAQTFIPNPDNLPEVNHKDNDRTKNNVDNLEWCTPEYNIEYREKYGVAQNHSVFAINLSTLKVSRFRSQSEASRKLGVFVGNLNKVIKGKLKQTGGFWFTNVDENAVETTKNQVW